MSYTCPRCGAVSHNPNDERERYCGRCHAFEVLEGPPEAFGWKRRPDLDSDRYDGWQRANGDQVLVPPGTAWLAVDERGLEGPALRECDVSPGLRAAIQAARGRLQ